MKARHSIICWAAYLILRASSMPLMGQAPDSSLRGANEWQISLYQGFLWKHSPKLTIATGHSVRAVEWGWQVQTRGRHDWHAAHRFPALGVSLFVEDLGPDAHGKAAALLSHLTLPIVKWPSGQVQARVASGLGWVQKPHDSFQNSRQNALGSKINNATQFQIGMSWRCSPKWALQAGGSLTHFSNGAFELPNFGVNVPGGFLSFRYSPAGIRAPVRASKPVLKRVVGRRWGFSMQAALARSEYVAIDGPKFGIWSIAGGPTWRLHRFNRLAAGLEREFNPAVRDWGLHSSYFSNELEAQKGATRWGFYMGDEFFYGPLSIYLQAGWHFGSPAYNRLTPVRNYNKLTARYYLPWPRKGARIHVGVTLKAYMVVAEYIAFQTGWVF